MGKLKIIISVILSLLITTTAYSSLNLQAPAISVAMVVLFVPLGASYASMKVLDLIGIMIKIST